MKGIEMTKYTSGDGDVIAALQQYGFAYDMKDLGDFAVTTLNKLKAFLERYIGIRNPTRNLIEGILIETNTGKYLGKGIDTGMNMCNLFLVHGEGFKDGVMDLIETGKLRKKRENVNL